MIRHLAPPVDAAALVTDAVALDFPGWFGAPFAMAALNGVLGEVALAHPVSRERHRALTMGP